VSLAPAADTGGFALLPVGVVRHEGPGGNATRKPARIELSAAYRDGLLELGRFSHVIVVWWAADCDTPADRSTLRVHPRPAPQYLMGVFATRSPARPNPVALSVCRLVAVDEDAGVVRVAAIDADDGSPVVDLKPYIPSSDRVRTARMPEWFPPEPRWACEPPRKTTD
jgi:tRNA-Thr(GGU) m(6)t(6)A37 methyltransferase TsaA